MRGALGAAAAVLLVAVAEVRVPLLSSPAALVGPLEATVGRNIFGACQVRLRNVGEVPLEAWVVTVHSTDARHTTIVRHDGWRDAYHVPDRAITIARGETRAFTIDEDGARGTLDVEISLVVDAQGRAFGLTEPVRGLGTGPRVLQRIVDARRSAAGEARAHAEAIESALSVMGARTTLESRVLSRRLESDGEANWWRLREQTRAAEAAPAATGSIEALRQVVAELRRAHAQGMAAVRFEAVAAEPARTSMPCG